MALLRLTAVVRMVVVVRTPTDCVHSDNNGFTPIGRHSVSTVINVHSDNDEDNSFPWWLF